MKSRRITLHILGILAGLSANAAQLSDGAGLRLDVSSAGRISTVNLNGSSVSANNDGGFYLAEPNQKAKRIPVSGKTTKHEGKLYFQGESKGLQARVRVVFEPGDGFIQVRGELMDLSGKDRGLWMGFNLPADLVGWEWGKTLSVSSEVKADGSAFGDANNLVPIPTVWNKQGGLALAIPPMHPCVFEVGADGEGLRVQMAYGLSAATTKFPSRARFCFRIYSVDPVWGYRDALAKYFDWYPDYYSLDPKIMAALDHHHDWISVNYAENKEVKRDSLIDQSKTRYMGYTKTSARIQNLKGADKLKTREDHVEGINRVDTIQHYAKKAKSGDPLLEEGRLALLSSICYEPDGNFSIFSQGPTEVDYPHNCDPDLFVDKDVPVFADMYLRKAVELRKISGFDSIHWDRLGGWSNNLNYRKAHFAYIDHPLTFDQEGRPCIHTQFTNYELYDKYRKLAETGGLYQEAAGMKQYNWSKMPNQPAGQMRGGQFFLASVVAAGWQEGSFKPIGLGGFDFERMVVGRKAYRVSSGNMIEHNNPPTLEVIKNALAKTTAYGFACPVQIQYFYTPDHAKYRADYSWISKPEHRDLWDRYEPASLAIRLAGWEPVTHAWPSSDEVQVQRFGKGKEIYFTVWGPEPPASVDIEIDANGLGLTGQPSFHEMVSEVDIKVKKSVKGWTITVPMEKNMTRVIRVR